MGPLYSNPSTSGDYTLQHEPKRQTDQIIYPAPGLDAITLEATECYGPGAGTLSRPEANHIPRDNPVDFGNSADGSGSSLGQSMQFEPNNLLYGFQILTAGIPNHDTSAPLPNVLEGLGKYQTHSRRFSESDILTSQGVYGSLSTYLEGSQPHEVDAVNNTIEQIQIQRKRKPSVEVGICYMHLLLPLFHKLTRIDTSAKVTLKIQGDCLQ